MGKKSASRRGDLVAAAMGAYVSRLWPSDPTLRAAFDGNLQSKIRCVTSSKNVTRYNEPRKPLLLIGLCWCREGESNPQGTKYRRILSCPRPFPTNPFSLSYSDLRSSACADSAVLF